MTYIETIAVVLGQHRAKYDSFDQNIDSWYCTCDGIRQYRSQAQVEQQHIASKIAEAVGVGPVRLENVKAGSINISDVQVS